MYFFEFLWYNYFIDSKQVEWACAALLVVGNER